MSKIFDKTSITAISISLLFLISSISAPIVVASTNSKPAPLASTPLSQLEANWAAPDGNQFNHNYSPQHQLNSSNAQYLGLNWLFPLPTHPTALISVAGGLGVDTAPLIVNGTIYFVTQFDQVFALNAANGNVLWTDVIPVLPNSTAGKGTGSISLHLHNGNVQFSTALFNHTPTFWVGADDMKVYAINALSGKYELNFSVFDGVNTVAGTHLGAQYTGVGVANILVDQNKGILISSVVSASSPNTGRCFYRGWDLNASPPKMIWEAYCTPPQPNSSVAVDPTWTIKMVNGLKGAQIFYPGPQYHNGGPIPASAVVDLKKLSPAQLNSTLYDDWGSINQTPACKAATGGVSTGSTAAGWGAPWVLGTGPTAGYAFVNTNNPDPYNSACTLGPELWSASVLALNETNGQWIWAFQTSAHDQWDLDCSWWQGLGNETLSAGGGSTQVLWKLCKNGYLYELNAQTGAMIWAYTPPITSIARCPKYCDMLDPLNRTQMTEPYFAPDRTAAGVGTLMYPGAAVGESEASYSPALNYIFFADEILPVLTYYVPINSTNYKTNSGALYLGQNGGPLLGGGPNAINNATISAVNAATGQLVWSFVVHTQGYRGGVSNSGNIVFLTLSSGDLMMLDASTGKLIKDYYIGGPLNVLPSIGATSSGQVEVIVPITAGIVTWGTGVPGDIVALTLQNVPTGGATNTVTSTSTVSGAGQVSTATTTVTAAGTSGADSTTLYGIAAVAVIFIIATGFLAMRGRRRPAL